MRQSHVPIALWIPLALVVHALSGGSAYGVAEVADGRMAVLAFAKGVRSDVRQQVNPTTEITIDLAPDPDTEKEPDPPKDAPDDPTAEADPAPATAPKVFIPKAVPPKPLPPKVKPKPPPPKPPEKPKTEEQKKKEEEEKKKKEEEEKKKKAEKPLAKIVLPKPDGRLAIQNDPNVKKDQAPNDKAPRIADHANHTDAETMAKFRSYDRNDSNPEGGGPKDDTQPDTEEPGNGATTKRGFSVDVPTMGPSRAGAQKGAPPSGLPPVAPPPGAGRPPTAGVAGVKGQKAIAGQSPAEAGGAKAGAAGDWSISADADGPPGPTMKGRKGQAAVVGRQGWRGRAGIPGALSPREVRKRYGINAFGVRSSLGKSYLRREEERARNARLARHRGKFKANPFQKFRAAIENYDPSVKLGNQTNLNAAGVPFASYINRMHNRIHPIFADGFLRGLDRLPAKDKLQNQELSTHMELVLKGTTGVIVRAGIVRHSGVTAFDAGALSSVHAAGPFGPAPNSIVSWDGNVYVHWEFYRKPYYACTSRFARPYVIRKRPGKKVGPRRPVKRPKPNRKPKK